jgi:hypothetical protein
MPAKGAGLCPDADIRFTTFAFHHIGFFTTEKISVAFVDNLVIDTGNDVSDEYEYEKECKNHDDDG